MKYDLSDMELMTYLESALTEEHGLEIETSDLDYLRRRIYALIAKRKAEGDERMRQLSLTTSPYYKNKLWIVKEEQEDGKERSGSGNAEGNAPPVRG
jgi:hypothetical protein